MLRFKLRGGYLFGGAFRVLSFIDKPDFPWGARLSLFGGYVFVGATNTGESPSSRGALFSPYPLQRRTTRQEFTGSFFEDFIYPVNEPLVFLHPPVPLSMEFEQHVCEPFRVFRGPGPLHPFPKLRGGYGFSIFTESLLEFGTQEPVYFALVDCPAMLKEFNA